MEEKVIKESKGAYFKSATNMLEGYLVLTNERIMFSGTQARVKLNHGLVGNVIRDKMEKGMGYDSPEEELIFDMPISEVEPGLKRFGLSKRLVLKDKSGNEFKIMINGKAERDEWPGIIENAKKENA